MAIVSDLYAERPPERREDATYVITGTVDGLYVRKTRYYSHYIVKIRVEQVERGKDLQPGDVFYAACFRRDPNAPREPSPQGHATIPREGQRVRVYVNDLRGENEGVYPNWVDILGRDRR
jgi:hypothetical protein